MPIRPENKKRYPANWSEIREKILKRADHKCEWPGCGVPNHSMRQSMVAKRDPATGDKQFSMIKVVLTIAHLNHRPEDCRDENLMALCQKCHNRYDAYERAKGRARRRDEKKKQKATAEPCSAAMLSDLLGLVSYDIPVSVISYWSQEDIEAVANWASCIHLRASDNPVKVPPKPEIMNQFREVDFDHWEKKYGR